jgi:hopanoid biosynthesis associated radical SAM protein HpnJ
MRTLFLNPPSFEGFDGGASSRWPATREIESYWYPIWLCYPAGLLPDSRVVDAPPHGITIPQVVEIARDFELLVLFTSTPGFGSDVRMAEMMKDANPRLKVAFVGPHASVLPEESLKASKAIDFIVRGEFDYPIVDYANGKPLEEIAGVSYRQNGSFRHNPEMPKIQDLDAMPWVSKVYRRDFDFTRYNIPFLLHPYISMFTARGCPALCTFCLWPQTLGGHPWRTRSADDVAAEVRYALENFPGLKEIFFDDDTFNIKKARVLELCAKLKPLNFTWSCTSRVTVDYETLKAMKEAGCRLLIVGYESGDAQILKNIKKGATLERAAAFTRDCKKLGLVVHGTWMVGLPGETRESIRRTIEFAKRMDNETIQVSIAHPYPGTEFYDYVKQNNLITIDSMTDEGGHQLPNIIYPGLDRAELMDSVERFYDEFYFRPRVVWRIVRGAIFDGAERRRLYKEAREFMALRAKRKKFIVEQRRTQVAAGP